MLIDHQIQTNHCTCRRVCLYWLYVKTIQFTLTEVKQIFGEHLTGIFYMLDWISRDVKSATSLRLLVRSPHKPQDWQGITMVCKSPNALGKSLSPYECIWLMTKCIVVTQEKNSDFPIWRTMRTIPLCESPVIHSIKYSTVILNYLICNFSSYCSGLNTMSRKDAAHALFARGR